MTTLVESGATDVADRAAARWWAEHVAAARYRAAQAWARAAGASVPIAPGGTICYTFAATQSRLRWRSGGYDPATDTWALIGERIGPATAPALSPVRWWRDEATRYVTRGPQLVPAVVMEPAPEWPFELIRTPVDPERGTLGVTPRLPFTWFSHVVPRGLLEEVARIHELEVRVRRAAGDAGDAAVSRAREAARTSGLTYEEALAEEANPPPGREVADAAAQRLTGHHVGCRCGDCRRIRAGALELARSCPP